MPCDEKHRVIEEKWRRKHVRDEAEAERIRRENQPIPLPATWPVRAPAIRPINAPPVQG